MTARAGSLVGRLLSALARQGFVATPDGPDTYAVSSRAGHVLRLAPRLVVSEDVLADYVDVTCRSIGSRETAFGIALLNVVESFDVDHGGGNNYTQLVAFRRDGSGVVVIDVEQDVPDLPIAADGPHEWRAERAPFRSP